MNQAKSENMKAQKTMDKGFVTFKKCGYIPTSISNCSKYTLDRSDYGVYLNEDQEIAEHHKKSFKSCLETRLKFLYENQGKPSYASTKKYPNAPFIVFKK